jgi:hypothetical protein
VARRAWVSMTTAAELAGVTRGTAAYWARRGLVRSRWSPAGRWPRSQPGREIELCSLAEWARERAERMSKDEEVRS